MAENIVIGGGPTGSATARLLQAEGASVVIASRTRSPLHPVGVEHVAVDATDGVALAKASRGGKTLFMCAMAPYHRWPEDFPPILEGVLTAARAVGARLVMVGNAYGYGEHAPLPLTERTPLAPTTRKGRVRAEMWRRACESGVPSCEVRASDFLGYRVVSHFGLLAAPAILSGKPVPFPGDHDAPHAWTFTDDVARTLIAAARSDASFGRAFHVPSQHTPLRALAARFAELGHAPPPSLVQLTRADIEAQGDPIANELVEMLYLLDRPCILDGAETTRVLGVRATPLDEMIKAMLAGFASPADATP